MSLTKIYLRYYPPGLALNCRTAEGKEMLQHIDLLDLKANTRVERVMKNIANELQNSVKRGERNCDTAGLKFAASVENKQQKHTLNSPKADEKRTTPDATFLQQIIDNYTDPLRQAIAKLQRKLLEPTQKKFYLQRRVAHLLPLTNICFDRSGTRCLTGSYDRICRIINTHDAVEEPLLLKGHDNVVFSVAFNQPKCDKVVTGSFDGTARVWQASNAQSLCTLYGHTAELVMAEFDPIQSSMVTTASMDGSARLFDIETAFELQQLRQHGAEVIASRFSRCGNMLLTASFDSTAAIWDIRAGCLISQLRGHTAELSNCVWNFSCDRIATASLDSTAQLWDVRRLDVPLHNITGHREEVLDVCFDPTGCRLATCSSDCTARVWDLRGELVQLSIMEGHKDEVSKVCFSPPGALLMTASADNTARLWLTESGQCSQVLSGHDSEVFSCAFSYAGDIIVTASKDNTCRLWR
ncbi:dynein assembly factor with WDR repeat domains 1 [Zeugodacus cucurbitae]|uniref:dynein assembly factor with WDR repeat domains 1 n=1 Tax=Zeugodacus cucurbitae TaxID=28588 RepID=UPI0010A74775|nr:dynein assembly factor with WDR repeat domains 1 [Zeugodacus cucurbitae]